MGNGFFQVLYSEKGTYLKVTKADGGEAVKVNEVMEYLNTQGIPYDLVTLNQNIGAANQGQGKEMIIPINPQIFRPINEIYKMWTSPDRMQVVARFYPPSTSGQRISMGEFLKDLSYQKVTYGIKNPEIEKFLASPRYCTDIVIAEGTPPNHGTDARIEYFFNTDVKAKPTLNDDGSVDFFHLNTINQCTKGQMLAKLIPADEGDYGYTVYGEKIKPRDIKRLFLKKTNNVFLSEDNLTMFASVDGHVTFVDGKVFVSNILTLDNVNTATGNIEYEGSVVVLGNVFANFSVKTKGNIEVRGVVEGAYLESEADIIIARGMKGMGRGTLKAGGNVIAQFLENAKVEAGGYVSTDSILLCDVVAGTEINVTSKKGFITGGKVCAGNLVQVKTLGSDMGSATIVEVGMDPTAKIKIQKLQKRVAELSKDIKNAQPILNAAAQKIAQGVRMHQDQIKYIQNLTIENKQKSAELENAMVELEELQKIYELSAGAQILVTGDVYAGTQICIGDLSMAVKSSLSYCKFVKQQGEIKMMGL